MALLIHELEWGRRTLSMKKTDKDFDLVNLPQECNDPSIKREDFKLVQVDEKIHDQKCRWPLETGKEQEMGSLLAAPERNTALLAYWCYPSKAISDFWLLEQ